MLLELDGLAEGGTGVPPVIRKYTWGLDLAGQSGEPSRDRQGAGQSAGGIGGLLALHDPDDDGEPNDPNDVERNYVYFYDANGNVGQLIDWENDGTLVARYEYDPYGSVIGPDTDEDGEWQDDAGPYATENPIRFSTKYFDDETALGYWGYRYYSVQMGRWLSRDPLGDPDSENLYVYADNGTSNAIDALGLQVSQPAVDKSQACCYYKRRSYWLGPLKPSVALTITCPRHFSSPTECCKCCLPKRKHLAKASWGACCFCTVQVQKLKVGPVFGSVWNVGAHERLVVVCDNGERVIAEMRGTVNAGMDKVEIKDVPVLNPGREVRIWDGPQAIRIGCDCAAPLIKQLKALKGKTLPYIIVVSDCRHFARRWFKRFKDLSCYHDPNATKQSLKNVDFPKKKPK